MRKTVCFARMYFAAVPLVLILLPPFAAIVVSFAVSILFFRRKRRLQMAFAFISLVVFLLYERSVWFNRSPILAEFDGAEGYLTADSALTKGGSTLFQLHADRLHCGDIAVDTDSAFAVLVQNAEERGIFHDRYHFVISSKISDGLYSASKAVRVDRSFSNRLRQRYLVRAEKNIMTLNSHFCSENDWNARIIALKLLMNRNTGDEDEMGVLAEKAGVTHVFALSGMHLDFVLDFCCLLLSLFVSKRKVKFAVLPFVSLYFFLTCRSASFIRSYIMFMLSLFIPFSAPLKFFCAFAIQLLLVPESCAGTGFCFSYCATAGLIMVGNLLRFVFSQLAGRKFSLLLSASVAATLFSAPVSIVNYGCFRPVGILLTPVVSIVAVIILAAAFALVFLPGNIVASAVLKYTFIPLGRCLRFVSEHAFGFGWAGYAAMLLVVLIAVLFCFSKKVVADG